MGELRWRPPQDPESWEGVRLCDTYSDACAQFDRWGSATDDVTDDYNHPYIRMPNYPYPPKMSEDCLYLNVYTPAETPEERLPVLMYIHGGGFQQWYGNDYEYCGDGFCRHGCVVVSINYRLNVFGYLVHPELAAESGHDASGNYGLMDQIKALEWVHENIAAFGGDPERITVFGQSAGGRASLAVAESPWSRDWVKRISVQSAGGLGGRPMGAMTREEAERRGLEFMKDVGCSSLAEMRALPWQKLRDANDKLGFFRGFNLYTDGWVLPEDIDKVVNEGRLRDIDIITGCTVDEGAGETPPRFGSMAAQVRTFAARQRENGKKPVHVYVFDRPQPGDDNVGTPHSCDNRYQFGSLDACWRPYEGKDWLLSEKMQSYWANFAATGDPNGPGLEIWEPYGEKGLAIRLSVDGCTMEDYNERTGGRLGAQEQEYLAALR